MPTSTAKSYLWLASTPAGVYNAWSDAPLPSWRDQLDAGPGEIRAVLPRSWRALGIPGDDLATNDLVLGTDGATAVRIYKRDLATAGLGASVAGDLVAGEAVAGNPAPGLQFLYAGTLEELTPTVAATKEDLEFAILPAHSLLTSHLDDVLVYADRDPVDIARNLFERGYLPTLTWDPRNPSTCGRVISQTFQYQTYKSIFDFLVAACGAGWYWHVDEHGQFRLWQPDTSAVTHTVQIGRELAEAQYTMTRVLMRNQVIMRGKGQATYTISTGTVSGTADLGTGAVTGTAGGMGLSVTVPLLVSNQKSAGWSRANARSAIFDDPTIDDQATLDLVAAAILARLNVVSVRARLRLVSNAGALAVAAVYVGNLSAVQPGMGWAAQSLAQLAPTSARGALLETVKPGDTLQLWLDGRDPARFVVGDAVAGTAQVNGSMVGINQRPQLVSATNYNGGDTLDVELSTPQPNSVSGQQRIQQLVEKALGAAVNVAA